MTYSSTREVAAILKVNPSRLSRAIWDGRLAPPMKGPSGSFLWVETDIQRASWVLRRQSADDILEQRKSKIKEIQGRTD